MSYHNNPRIVTDGLTLCLDANAKRSYPGTGTTWFDLTPNQQNGSLSGLTFNSSGYFDSDGTDDVVGPSTFDYDDSGGAFTVCAWVNPDSLTNANSYSAIINRSDNSNHIFSLYMNKSAASSNVGDMSAWIFDDGGTLRQHSASGNCILNVNEWNFCVWRWRDNFGFTFDLFNSDGQATQTASSSYVSRKDSTSQFTIGRWRNSGYYFNGKIGCANLYNRKLSNAKVLQNYNSMKSRFGL
jgi:hypothetical protein